MEKIKKFIIETPWLTADFVTYSRLFFFSPLVIFFSLKGEYLTALIIFILGNISDALDGYIARLKDQTKERGIIFDAGTDKIFILLPFLTLGLKFLDHTPVTLMLALEIFHVLLVLIGRTLKFPIRIAANLPYRIKMWFLGFSVGFLLLNPIRFTSLSSAFLYAAIITATLSLAIYLVKWIKELTRVR